MNILNELKNKKISSNLLNKINEKSHIKMSIMEVCGTQTNTILKSGIKGLLPKNIKLINGPGCPVCVTPQSYIDMAIKLSKKEDIIITTFGDLMRVPGKNSSLSKEKAKGNDIRVVYSPLDSLNIAKENRDKKVVFLAIGFETTAPIIALAIKQAEDNNIKNFFILNALKTMPEAMKNLVLNPKVKIDGFLCPGHVATIIGEKPFKALSENEKIPMVVCGFEVNDILASIYKLITMKENNKYGIENTYTRLVKYEGNKNAINILEEVFDSCPSIWRGLGSINSGGLSLRSKYSKYDILNHLKLNMLDEKVINGCSCGDILIGVKEPTQCNLFKKVCTPENPIGPCMVSEEGTCSSYFKYIV